VENLHEMARILNIKRCWYHGGDKPHYDIPKRRIQEIMEKCEVVSSQTIFLIINHQPMTKPKGEIFSLIPPILKAKPSINL
jgi:hypothetical protein